MTWTSGKWIDVAIGDDVLGADGYAWRVSYAVPDPHESGRVKIIMERDGREAVTGSIPDSKPAKYRKAEPSTVPICPPRQIEDWESVAIDSASNCPDIPAPATEREAWIRREAEETGESIEGVRALLDDVDPVMPAVIPEPKPATPYVEYDDAERAAAAALKGAGLQMTVIERQMTLDGLTEHIGNVHGEPLPGAGGNVTRIELRSRLADLHFQLHEKDQPRGQRWEPRGSTAHVHPVMDRPTGDPEPTSFRAKR